MSKNSQLLHALIRQCEISQKRDLIHQTLFVTHSLESLSMAAPLFFFLIFSFADRSGHELRQQGLSRLTYSYQGTVLEAMLLREFHNASSLPFVQAIVRQL